MPLLADLAKMSKITPESESVFWRCSRQVRLSEQGVKCETSGCCFDDGLLHRRVEYWATICPARAKSMSDSEVIRSSATDPV